MINVEKFKEAMAKISDRVAGEETLLSRYKIQISDGNNQDGMDAIREKCGDTTFRLLIMGRFNSGKSAFVNVLLGEQLLPEKALPTTAIITEIQYGEKKRVVVYPRKGGGWVGGEEPFDIKPEYSEIKKYCTINNTLGINNKDANRVDSMFEKMVVYWPLDILKEGVILIDSPGTDDPYQNDHIVEEYLPKADAVLYCINGTNAYCAKDAVTLSSIGSKGFVQPIIVTTYFDVISKGMDEDELQEYMDATYLHYSNHTSREYCHYIDSLMGMQAKKLKSEEALAASGYGKLEEFLSRYLTEYKGREKIASAAASIELYNQKVNMNVESMISNLDASDVVFANRVAEAEKNLDAASKRGELLKKEFAVKIKKAEENVEKVIPSLLTALDAELTLDDFDPATNFTLFHPKKSSESIAEECAAEIKVRNKIITNKWNSEVLSPAIAKEFENMAEDMREKFDKFSADIIKANVSMGIEVEAVDSNVKGATRVAAFAYALLTGDWITALIGGALGMAALGRTMLCQFAAGFIVGIIALFTPVGLPALVIANLLAMIGGLGWTASVAAKTIKKKSIEKTKEHLVKERDKIIEDIRKACHDKVFEAAKAKMTEAVAADIDDVKQMIKKVKDERKNNSADITARKGKLKEILQYNQETQNCLKQIKEENKIA